MHKESGIENIELKIGKYDSKREGEKGKLKTYQNGKEFCVTKVKGKVRRKGKKEKWNWKHIKNWNLRACYYNSGILGTKYSNKGLHKGGKLKGKEKKEIKNIWM